MKLEITITIPHLKIQRRALRWPALLLTLILVCTVATVRTPADTGTCGGATITLPFTDVMGSGFFCFIAQLYFQGISVGTSPTTYSPSNNVTRDQMAAFLSRTQNGTLQRGSRRAALNQFWTTTPRYTITQGSSRLGATSVGNYPQLLAADGADIWVGNNVSGTVSRVRASDGKLLETWTGATDVFGLVVALGRVFMTGNTSPGRLYVIEPSQPAGAVTTLSTALGNDPRGIAFDGQRLWTANQSGSVSIITPGAPFTVTNVGGFGDLFGVAYDGANIWVTEDGTPGQLHKLDANGAVLTTVTVGNSPRYLIFDGTNLWVPNFSSNTVSVVRPSDGAVLATLSGNGLSGPRAAAFDGQRVLATNYNGHSVSLWKAADLTPLGSFSTGAGSVPFGACSDGVSFWITLYFDDKLARF